MSHSITQPQKCAHSAIRAHSMSTGGSAKLYKSSEQHAAPCGRQRAILVADTNYVYLLGGEILPNTILYRRFTDVWRYNLLTGKWTLLDTRINGEENSDRVAKGGGAARQMEESAEEELPLFPHNSLLFSNTFVTLPPGFFHSPSPQLRVVIPDLHSLGHDGLDQFDFYSLELLGVIEGSGGNGDTMAASNSASPMPPQIPRLRLTRLEMRDEDGTLADFQFSQYQFHSATDGQHYVLEDDQNSHSFYVYSVSVRTFLFQDKGLKRDGGTRVKAGGQEKHENQKHSNEQQSIKEMSWRCISAEAHARLDPESMIIMRWVSNNDPLSFLFEDPASGQLHIGVIPNGIDKHEWMPAFDASLKSTYPILTFNLVSRRFNISQTEPDLEFGFPSHCLGTTAIVAGMRLYLVGGLNVDCNNVGEGHFRMRSRLWSLELAGTLRWCATHIELPVPVRDCALAYSPSGGPFRTSIVKDSILYVFGGLELCSKEGIRGQTSACPGGYTSVCSAFQSLPLPSTSSSPVSITPLSRLAQRSIIRALPDRLVEKYFNDLTMSSSAAQFARRVQWVMGNGFRSQIY